MGASTQLIVCLAVFCVMTSWMMRDVDARDYQAYDTSRPGASPCGRTRTFIGVGGGTQARGAAPRSTHNGASQYYEFIRPGRPESATHEQVLVRYGMDFSRPQYSASGPASG